MYTRKGKKFKNCDKRAILSFSEIEVLLYIFTRNLKIRERIDRTVARERFTRLFCEYIILEFRKHRNENYVDGVRNKRKNV